MDNRLVEARKEINEIDKQLADLFEKRMHTVRKIAEYKRDKGMPIFDSGREQEVIAKNSELLEDKALVPYFKKFLEESMAISREYQKTIIEESQC